MTEIETSRLLLRRWREGDLEAYACICADPEVMRYLPATLGREESAEQMAGFAPLGGARIRALGCGGEGFGRVHRLYRTDVP